MLISWWWIWCWMLWQMWCIYTLVISYKQTFVVTDPLYIYKVISLPVHKIALILWWCYYSDMGPVNTSNNTRKTSQVVKTLFDYGLLLLCCWEFYESIKFTSDIHSYTTDKPTVDFICSFDCITCNLQKLAIAKNRSVINTWFVAEIGKLLCS